MAERIYQSRDKQTQKLTLEIDAHVSAICRIILEFVNTEVERYPNGQVPILEIKKELGLMHVCYPVHNKTQKAEGWLFAICCRRLEDDGLIIYHNESVRSYVSLPE